MTIASCPLPSCDADSEGHWHSPPEPTPPAQPSAVATFLMVLSESSASLFADGGSGARHKGQALCAPFALPNESRQAVQNVCPQGSSVCLAQSTNSARQIKQSLIEDTTRQDRRRSWASAAPDSAEATQETRCHSFQCRWDVEWGGQGGVRVWGGEGGVRAVETEIEEKGRSISAQALALATASYAPFGTVCHSNTRRSK